MTATASSDTRTGGRLSFWRFAQVYNEEELLETFYARVCAALEELRIELVLVDDGSRTARAAGASG